MNIILFYQEEVQLPLPRHDPRAAHLLGTLRRQPGDLFDAGLINGPRGKGRLVSVGPRELVLSFEWNGAPPPLCPISLIVGLPRPQTARDILREATSLGVGAIHFVPTEKGESSYAGSSLWRTGAWRECVINGAAQSFTTRIPIVTHDRPLTDILASLPEGHARLALDNYEAAAALDRLQPSSCAGACLALGAERGWSAAERLELHQAGFSFVHLGERILRVETACIAAVTLVKARFGWT